MPLPALPSTAPPSLRTIDWPAIFDGPPVDAPRRGILLTPDVADEDDGLPALFPPSDGPMEARMEQAAGMPPLVWSEHLDPAAEAAAPWLTEIAHQLVDRGERYVRGFLRLRGFSALEVETWLRAARERRFIEYSQTDIEQRRTLVADRLEQIYVQARESLDLKTATSALKNYAVVTGVIKEEAQSGVGELAALAKALSSDGRKVGVMIEGPPQK